MMMATCCGSRLTSTKAIASEYHAAPKAARTTVGLARIAKLALMEHESDIFGGYGPASGRLRLFFSLASI